MRSYGQYCGLAKALDVIGDRWSLLIVRELLLRDGCRYTDLRDGLPGIATNLLADRLRDLERAGVVQREEAPPPVAATLFRLTDRGRDLRAAVHALGRWGGPLLAEDFGDDEFRGHWLALPIQIGFGERFSVSPPVLVGVGEGDDAAIVEFGEGGVHARAWTDEVPDVVLGGSPRLVVGVLTGFVALDDARARGLECQGDVAALRRLLREAPHEADLVPG
jgi:DNA-binding HxlR family transcriptional regulator